MITKDAREDFLVTWYVNNDKFDEAISLIRDNPNLNHLLRQVALRYSDLEDVDNSIKFFQLAYESGDLKSLPWLIEALENFRPDDHSLNELNGKLAELVEQENFDVIFSLGNIAIVRQDYQSVLGIWRNLLHKKNPRIDLNLIELLIQNPMDPILRNAVGIDKNANEEQLFTRLENMLGEYALSDSHSLWVLGILYMTLAEHIEDEDKVQENYLNQIFEFARQGDIGWIFQGFVMAQEADDPRASQFLGLINEFQLNQLFEMVNGTGPAEVNPSVTPSLTPMPDYNVRNIRINEIFDEALEAQKNLDYEKEISLWIEGAKLGNRDALHNFAVSQGNRMGISCGMFGCTGAEGSIWGDLVKNIQQNEMRNFDKEIYDLELTLGTSLLNPFREKIGAAPVQKNTVPTGDADYIDKLTDVLDELFINYVKVSADSIAIPYADSNVAFQVHLELIQDDAEALLLIHSPLLYGDDPLTLHEKNLIRMLVRNSALIFPTSGLSFDIFGVLPDDKVPNFFINRMAVCEIPVFLGGRIDEVVFDFIPTTSPITQHQIGVSVSLDLESDHFYRAVSESLKVITMVAEGMQNLRSESEELYALNFDHLTSRNEDTLPLTIDMEKQIKLELPSALLAKAAVDAEKKSDPTPLLRLAKDGLVVAMREGFQYPINKKFAEFAGEVVLEISKNYYTDQFLGYYLNALGWFWSNEGKEDKSAKFFEASARLGCGNALSSFTWHCMLRGEFQRGVDLFNEVYYRVMTSRVTPNDFEQAANARSNNALNRWALGHNPDELKSVWLDDYLQGEHAESKFYPILVDYEAGRTQQALSDLSALPNQLRTELVETFSENRKNSKWFGEISRKSLKLLELIR